MGVSPEPGYHLLTRSNHARRTATAPADPLESRAQNSGSDGSSSNGERQSHGPPTGRGASCTNMNVNMAQGDGRDLPSSLTGASARSRGARSTSSDTRARSNGSDHRASVPRPVKGCGDSCTDMSVNMTQLMSRQARRARRRRDKQRRERALSRGALDEQRQQRAGQQQQQQQRRAAVPRSVKGRGDSCTYMDVIEKTAVTHSPSTTYGQGT